MEYLLVWSLNLLILLPLTLFSLPQGGEVVSGDVKISQQNSTTMHVKASDKSIVAFDQFHIGENESVKFIQPKSTSTVLVRDRSIAPSQIMGRMDANGRLFLINPNGIVFGPNSQVNVGSLIASTLNIDDRDFITGNYRFQMEEKNGFILNQGTIKGSESIALLAPSITEKGAIIADASRVVLAAAEMVTLDFTGDGLFSFAVDGELEKAVIEHFGSITANKSEIALYLKTADRLIKSVVNIDGLQEGVKIEKSETGIRILPGSELNAPKMRLAANDHILVDTPINCDTDLTITSHGGDVLLLDNIKAIRQLSISGKNIVQMGEAQSQGPVSYTGLTYLSGHVSSTNGSIDFYGPVVRTGVPSVKVKAGGGDIHFWSTIDADAPGKILNLYANKGWLTLDGPIGESGPLGDLSVNGRWVSLPNITVTQGLTVSPTERVHLTGSRYRGGKQSWKVSEIHIDHEGDVLFSSPKYEVNFDQKAKIVLGHSSKIKIEACGGKLSELKALQGGHVVVESPGDSFTLGEITGTLSAIQVNADQIYLSGKVFADMISLKAEGNILNLGQSCPLFSHGSVTLVSRSGSIGSHDLPLHIEAPKGQIIVGAKHLVKIVGNSSDTLLHVIHGQRPKEITFNGDDHFDFSPDVFLDLYREDEILSLMPDIARKKNPEAIDSEALAPRSAPLYYQEGK